MIQRDRSTLIGVAGNSVYIPTDHTQRMRDHSDHVTVLLNIFRKRVPHETPSGNITHPGNQGEKVVVHNILQSGDFDGVAGSLYHPVQGTSTGENQSVQRNEQAEKTEGQRIATPIGAA